MAGGTYIAEGGGYKIRAGEGQLRVWRILEEVGWVGTGDLGVYNTPGCTAGTSRSRVIFLCFKVL